MTIDKISKLIAYLDTRYTLVCNEIEERRHWHKNLERMSYDETLSAERCEEIYGELDQIYDELDSLQKEANFLYEMKEALRAWEI